MLVGRIRVGRVRWLDDGYLMQKELEMCSEFARFLSLLRSYLS